MKSITYRIPEPEEVGLVWCESNEGRGLGDGSYQSDPYPLFLTELNGPNINLNEEVEPGRVEISGADDDWWCFRERTLTVDEAIIAFALATDQRHKIYVPTWAELGCEVMRTYDGAPFGLERVGDTGDSRDIASDIVSGVNLDAPEARWFVAVLLAIEAGLS